MMTLPETQIKIGARLYQVRLMTEDESDDCGLLGQCDKNKARIRLLHVDDRQLAVTFMHEVMHALYQEWCIADGDDEERTVDTLSNGLATVMVDNPTWFIWWGSLMK